MDQPEDNKDKIIDFESLKLMGPPEDKTEAEKRREKKRAQEKERNKHNDNVLRQYGLGKYGRNK